ncbi:MaoC family dehydratase [Thalassotalea sp. Y01]|uniref:MaoC family dehydratase n=1 Tax=Thalassotalea sp. Y01 TaxID=2729613 RepID=UPI00145C6E45|nr:MaoC family dehydratase [Thalassotalea sp. Y01]NMP15124.1 MaoC family dehydratase [Thalassotalea sp. Y01]
MNVVEFIREQKEQLQQRNDQFKARLEPKFKNISELISSRITNLTNTLNNPWFSKFADNEHDSETDCAEKCEVVVQTPKAEKAYNQLLAKLGQETYVGQWYTVDQQCINQFAEVTGDDQWIHTDPERAEQESPFKATIAHGFLTLSLLPKLTDTVNEDNNPYPDAKMVINIGLNQVRYPYPVKAGSRVRVRTRLIELKPMKRSIELVNEMSIEVENSKRLGCIAETVLRLYY